MEWFRQHAVQFDILGVNFYPWSYVELKQRPNGTVRHITGETSGDKIGIVLREAYQRYQMPMMVTETSAKSDLSGRARWMDETIDTVRALLAEGMPILGYTWFPLFSMIDWDYRKGRHPLSDYLLHLGLYECAFDSRGVLRRHKTPLVKRYRQHTASPLPGIGN